MNVFARLPGLAKRAAQRCRGALVFAVFLLLSRVLLGAPGSRRGVGRLFSRWGFDLFGFARVASAGLPLWSESKVGTTAGAARAARRQPIARPRLSSVCSDDAEAACPFASREIAPAANTPAALAPADKTET